MAGQASMVGQSWTSSRQLPKGNQEKPEMRRNKAITRALSTPKVKHGQQKTK
jgi:hypothetical protein